MTTSAEEPVAVETSESKYIDLNERDMIINLGLYQKIEIDPSTVGDVLRFLSRDSMINSISQNVIFDSFCPKCKKESTFRDLYTNKSISSTNLSVALDLYKNRTVIDLRYSKLDEYVFIKEYVCSRNQSHVHSFYFLFDGKHLTKVGQTLPRTAIFAMESKKYAKHFPEIQKELFISMKLYSDGIGVAAILYLRRIFEKLINMASSEYLLNNPQDEIKIKDARMADKINILKNILPSFLVENKHMYSILSSAVHELEEDVCLNAYPFIKDSILLILDQEIERILDRNKKDKLTKELQNFQSFLGRRKTK